MNGLGFVVLLVALGAVAGAIAMLASWMSRRTVGRRADAHFGAFDQAIASVRAEHAKLDGRGALHDEQRSTRGG